MNVKTLERIVSPPRLRNYIVSQGVNQKRAVALYEQNIVLSQSFYPLLTMLEVALRNSLDQACIAHFSDPNWLVNQKTGFMVDPKLTYFPAPGIIKTNDFLKRSVEEAEGKINRQKLPMSHGKIVAELTFGFWTELFEPTHYALLKGVPIKAFPNLPSKIKRKNLYSNLNEIRRFRNRIYHNEPICFLHGVCDTGEAKRIRNGIFNSIHWLSSDLHQWITKIDDTYFEILLTERYQQSAVPISQRGKEFITKLIKSLKLLGR
jgi:hypothetical protein